jgi:ribosomal protein S10
MNVKISIVLKSFETPKGSAAGGTQWGGAEGAQRGPLGAQQAGSKNGALLRTLGAQRKSTAGVSGRACAQKPVKGARLNFYSAKVTAARHCCARLPLRQSLYTVLRSPHIDKKSREQFEMKVHQQLIIISTDTNQLRDKLFHLKFHEMSGVQMKVIFHYKTRLKF